MTDATVAPPPRRVLVVGGARSGKSLWAERQLDDVTDVEYLATSFNDPDDAEWQERVRVHQQRRPAHWRTIETIDVAGQLRRPGPPLLVDCLTVWLSRILDEADAWTASANVSQVERGIAEVADAVAESPRDVFLVSNEVGSGLVPTDPGSRLFRDLLGVLNASVAAACDQVWVCHVGIAKRWK